MKILLVSPSSSFPDVTPGWLRISQLALPLLAALTPPRHEVRMVEDEHEKLPLDEHWDLAGITAMTATATRAYEIAAGLRTRGTKVVLGGIHPSVLPGEAIRFADAVVIGEAEGAWPRVLHDAEHGRLERFYHNPQPDISASPLPARRPRRTLFGLPPCVMPIQATRGCPHDCEFCCVHRVYGRGERHLPIEHIVADIRRHSPKRVMFLDDNVGARRSYALRLFAALKPLRTRWSGQATVGFILDDELFRAAVDSGCEGLFVGIESVEPAARKSIHKCAPPISACEQAIRRCSAAGVLFHASLIFGLDEQTPAAFEHTLEFLLRNSVPSTSSNILTPYPGTRLFERYMREGRILHTRWAYYDHMTVCYEPKGMEPAELSEKYLDFLRRFFSWGSILKRSWAQWRVAPLVYLGMNLAFRGRARVRRKRFREYFRWLGERRAKPTWDGWLAGGAMRTEAQAATAGAVARGDWPDAVGEGQDGPLVVTGEHRETGAWHTGEEK